MGFKSQSKNSLIFSQSCLVEYHEARVILCYGTDVEIVIYWISRLIY